ncbi:GSCFA domain-containing protein [Gimibacter soli]|uniref:GSCFA domain-containing protein n=1 Tax=Gimibacter soli TaxID=3024400 RepID=A0AAF0BKP9_9PROT|nr:GSCFA domain-containing protein [Gimibacter soli]WCL53207.1 GSCFA domain-containing protein [Gimibacter soli]
MSNPYQSLGPSKFWRSGVAEIEQGKSFPDIWCPKYPVGEQSGFITAGSCFAQHVGKWLTSNGFRFSPSRLAPAFNFSFALGNIYTPALMRQWLEAAAGGKTLTGHIAETDGKFFDLLRPAVVTDGFESAATLQEAREKAIAEIAEQIRSAEIFVFTLGLTEAWRHSDGTVYPMCPGTICGTFDPTAHHFHNYGHAETLAEMKAVRRLAREINPDIRFLLTVSPVPLTATAADDHVLVATTYSKSVLRAVAGELAASHADIDYFPSFELIASPPIQGRYFEENQRNVKPEGVSFVMSHLRAGLGGAPQDSAQPVAADEDAICEELQLESWNNSSKVDTTARFCLVGDSHMPLLARSFARANIPTVGGMTMMGASWAAGKFRPDEDDFFVPLEGRASRRNWLQTLEHLEAIEKVAGKPVIVTNIGLNTRASVNQLIQWLQARNMLQNLDVNKCFDFFNEVKAPHKAAIKAFVDAGYGVVVFSDPPLQRFYDTGSEIEPFVELYEKLYCLVVRSVGAEFILVREKMAEEGRISEALCSDTPLADGGRDWMHGSDAYYDIIRDWLVALEKTKSPVR